MLLGMQETQSTNFSGNKCLYSSTLATPEDKSLLAEWKEYGLEVKRSRAGSGPAQSCYVDSGKSPNSLSLSFFT